MRPQLKSALIALSIILTPVSLIFVAITYAQTQLEPVTHLPIVRTSPETPVPTATATPTNTPTATPTPGPGTPSVTPTNTPTNTPTITPPIGNLCQLNPSPASAPNSPVMIDDIDKGGEIVALRNVSPTTVDLTGWHMCSINGDQEHPGISGLLAPGQVRSFFNGGGIWHDTQRDDGALYNAAGQLIAYDENID
jgi:lamin tail-like protein